MVKEVHRTKEDQKLMCSCAMFAWRNHVCQGLYFGLESSDCFEYPNNPYLNQAIQKNTCLIFLPKKISESKISDQKKVLQSSPSLEI